MRCLILLMIFCNLHAASWNNKKIIESPVVGSIVKSENWNKASGNENNFDIYAVSVAHNQFWRIDLKTGNIHAIGELGIDIKNAGLSFDNKGNLFMLCSEYKDKKVKLILAKIDVKTGKATKITEFDDQKNKTIGFEISQDGKHLYWINSNALYEIHLDGKIDKVMDLEDGAWCLTKAPGNKLFAIGLKTKNLMIIDPKTKTVKIEKDLSHNAMIPALASTPGGRLYCDDIKKNVMGINDKLIKLGTVYDVCHGFAIINDEKAK